MALGQLRGPSWFKDAPLAPPIRTLLSLLRGVDVCNGCHSRNVMKRGTPKTAVCAPTQFFTIRCPDRRWRVYRAACVDAGCEKSRRPRAPGGRTTHACHAPNGANQGERRHRAGLTPDYQQASGNKPQVRRCNGRLGHCPMCEGCNRRCSTSRSQRDAKIETRPRLARHGKFDGLTDTP